MNPSRLSEPKFPDRQREAGAGGEMTAAGSASIHTCVRVAGWLVRDESLLLFLCFDGVHPLAFNL